MTSQDDRQKSWDRGDDGTFKTGHAKRGGRKAGTPNATSPNLQMALLAAAADIGSDGNGTDGLEGYFCWLGVNHPDVYFRFLIKLMIWECLQERVSDLEKRLGIHQ